MLDKPISPLRQRMIDDMTARRFNEHTQRDYVRNGVCLTFRAESVSGEATFGRVEVRRLRDRTSRA